MKPSKNNYKQEILKIVLEKGILALLIVVATALIGYIFKLKGDQAQLRAELAKENRSIRLAVLNEQLSKFYTPLLFRLQIDNALWTRLPKLAGARDSSKKYFTKELEDIIENKYLLTNHSKMAEIIENNSHLASDNPQLVDSLIMYIRHEAVYQALRLSKDSKNENPIDYNEGFPIGLDKSVAHYYHMKQLQYNTLLNDITLDPIKASR